MVHSRKVIMQMCLTLAVLVTAGCERKAYTGPTRKPEEVAILRPEDAIEILAIDRMQFKRRFSGESFEVLPGRHSVRLRSKHSATDYRGVTTTVTSDSVVLAFDAKAGRTYIAGKSFTVSPKTGMGWTFYILDEREHDGFVDRQEKEQLESQESWQEENARP